MEGLKRRQMPTFGNWDFYNDIPLSGNYFHNDVDLFKVPQPSLPHHCYHKPMKAAEKQRQQHHDQQRKQGRVCDLTPQQQKQRRHRAPKAVDEDLYKIPPEFLYQKPKRRVVVACDFWKSCFGLSCIS